MIRTANDYNAVYATSNKKEGIIIITDTTHPFPKMAMVKMVWRMLRALGLKNFSEIMKKIQSIVK